MVGNIVIRDAKLLNTNFAGKERGINPEGKRNFCVYLDTDLAEELAADGWNVKPGTAYHDGEEPRPFLPVAVSFDPYPPKVYMVTSKHKIKLNEDTIAELDDSEFEKVDLIIRPYSYTVGNKSGVKAYLKSMYATIVEDELDLEYSDIPDSMNEYDAD